MTKTFLSLVFMAIVLLLAFRLLTGCAKASGGVHAETIPSNDGSTCYAIFDSNQNPIGGNCK